ncbi:hypothetical protein CHUAL_004592 [Chamberlinius hualienensis]
MAFLMIFTVFTSLFIIWIITKFLQKVPPPIYGQYTQKTFFYPFKKWLVYFYLKLVLKRKKLLSAWKLHADPSFSGYGVVASAEERRLETRDDVVEFCCSDADGNSFIGGVDVRENAGWLYVKLAQEELQLPLHPIAAATTKTFETSGMKLEPLEPLRRWKITFNGFLKKQSGNLASNDREEIVTGSLKFIWKPVQLELINSEDHRNDWFVAEAFAKEIWTPAFWRFLNRYQPDVWHEQWGVLEGKLKLDDRDEEIQLFLRGKKRRTCHESIDHNLSNTIYKQVAIDIYLKDGTVIHFNSSSFKNGLTENTFGYVIYCNGMYQPLKDCNFSLHEFAENRVIPQSLFLRLTTNQQDYNVQLSISTGNGFRLIRGTSRDQETLYFPVIANVDDFDGFGFLRVTYPYLDELPSSIPKVPVLLLESISSDRTQVVVPLTDADCRDGNFVGGKAMSLGLMTTISFEDFVVPKGVSVTVTAYWNQLGANPLLVELIQNLQSCCVNSDVAVIQAECDKVVKAIASTEVIPPIKRAIEKTLEEIFSLTLHDKRFAVRSSAVGEDGEDTSSAGQNETLLGVKGFDTIFASVSKCWASQFTFQAVLYRRQHGQPINCGMGVVIQEMVNAEVAGVLFTREPVSGNVSKMLITANYGLGESVVSAKCDPDTIYINRKWPNEVSILKREVGQKKSLITINETGSGTKTLEATSEQISNLCVDDNLAIQLARVGIILENKFGGPRDIEWAFSQGQLYLLQSRAITNLDKDDEWELVSELNSAPVADDDILTTANVSEVIPGALSPLSMSFLQASLDVVLRVFKESSTNVRFYAWDTMMCYGNHLLLSLTNMYSYGVNRQLSGQDIGAGHSILGRNIFEGGLHEILLRRHGEMTPKRQYKAVRPALRQLICDGSDYHIVCKRYLPQAALQLSFEDSDSAVQIYSVIDRNLEAFFKIAMAHMHASSASSVFAGVIISMLTANSQEFTDVHLSDLANLLGNCSNVVSADVPAAIDKLSETLNALPKETKEHLQKLKTEEVLHWLRNDIGKAGKEFADFMKIHGHRGFREMELISKTWADDPISLVGILQKSIRLDSTSKIQKKAFLSLSETINELQTPLSPLTKIIMKFILKKSKLAVGYREEMKSALVKICSIYRSAYRKLGKRMVEEGRLIDDDLVFYLTHYEIGQLLETRSARLIAKAINRRNLHPKLERLQFPSMIYGYHKINLDEEIADETNFIRNSDVVLKATCASRGKCRGIARVINDIHEASLIQPGDILITYATDICWSPYFPLLSGIVTELGGLVSHGAVVAREYGLPCLIAAENARKLFRSGDEVLLDATKGTIELISNSLTI